MGNKIKWKDAPWTPDESWYELIPAVSGNDVNGVGETESRRPTQIFWHRQPDQQTFAEVQKVVVGRFNSQPDLYKVYAEADRGPRKLPDVAAEKQTASAEQWTEQVKAFALNTAGARPEGYPGDGSEAELVGITPMDVDRFVYEGCECDLPTIIVLGVVMQHSRLKQLPGDDEQVEGQLEVADQYNRGARVSNYLAQWIRSMGYRAEPHAGPWVGSLNLVPAALAAGFGELGDHGSIINAEYGSSFRLAAVATDLPLCYDSPQRFGADEFCLRCQVCSNACPPQAISHEKKMVRGEYKWSVDFDKCMPYFNESYSCGICLAVCPWSTPERAPKLAATWSKRIEPEE